VYENETHWVEMGAGVAKLTPPMFVRTVEVDDLAEARTWVVEATHLSL